ncbi:MAG: hypothetical protein ACPG7F_09215 [Aggregatilineales bacterium]
MRYRLLFLLIPVWILAACDADTPAENTPIPATAVPVEATEDVPFDNRVIVTRAPLEEGALEVPPVGVLVASVTEDPEIDLVFDVITLRREGGIDEAPIEIVLNQNGSFTRDGVPGQITPADVTRIDDLIDEINFFGLQGTMMGPAIDEEDYRFVLRVERNGTARSITSQEGYIPPEYQRLLGAIFDVGFRIGT